MKEEYSFDFDEILDKFRSGKKLTGKGGVYKEKSKQLIKGIKELLTLVRNLIITVYNRYNLILVTYL